MAQTPWMTQHAAQWFHKRNGTEQLHSLTTHERVCSARFRQIQQQQQQQLRLPHRSSDAGNLALISTEISPSLLLSRHVRSCSVPLRGGWRLLQEVQTFRLVEGGC